MAPTSALGAVAIALAAIPAFAPLAAQSVDFEARVGPETLELVSPVLSRAAADSLPVEALRAKVLEGVAKGVAPARIAPVVADLADEFRVARAGLRQAMPQTVLTDGEVVAAALAARHGVPFEVLEPMWATREAGRPLDVPVTVLGELVRRGVPVPDAAGLMLHVAESGVPLAVTAQIPGKLDGIRAGGMSPEAALIEALRVLDIPEPPGRSRNR